MNKILTALLEQIQSFLLQVEDQGKRTAFEAGWPSNLEKNLIQTRLLQWGSTSYAEAAHEKRTKTRCA